MKTRVITGIVLSVILIPIFVYGGVPLNILLLLFTMGASYELFTMFNKVEKLSYTVLGIEMILSGVLYFVIQSYYNNMIDIEWIFLFIVFVTLVGALLLVFFEQFNANHFGQMFAIILYPALGFGALMALRYNSLYDLGFLFVITIMTDIFAYAVGVPFGKHRLAVKISPKKSIEGSVGGTFFAILITLGYLRLFNVEQVGEISMTIIVSVILVLFISIIGQIGDLVASKLKRHFEIKDYSNLFPGHGGIMDRFDSAIFAAMVLMLVSKVVGLL